MSFMNEVMELEIVQVVQELSTSGGAERVAWELARAFGRAGIANTVIASTIGEPVGGNTVIECVASWLSLIPTRGPLRHLGRAAVVPLFTLAATRALMRHRDAVVLSHGDCLRGDAMVVHAVNSENLAWKRAAGDRLWMLNPLHVWVRLRDRWMIGSLRYRVFVAVSARVAKELQKHYGVPPTRIEVIPNGMDVDRFSTDRAAGGAIRQELGIPADAKLLLFAGHEFRRKGLAHAIGALELLGPDVWLLVVGSDSPGSYRKMASRSAGRIVFAGARHDMPACYAAADALVHPTAYETFSLVCMEAMASGVPVLATRVGGIEDYLQDGVNGYTITTDPQDIASKVSLALSDEALMARLRAGARATALRYRWDTIAARYIDLARHIQSSRRDVAGALQAAAR
jgi:glycosyltransferase involved in cell wall biosynthesis